MATWSTSLLDYFPSASRLRPAVDRIVFSNRSVKTPSPSLYHVLAGAWIYFVFGLAVTAFGPTLQPIRESFGLGLAELGLIFPFMAVGYVIASLFGSPMSDRRGRRPFIIAGTTLMAAGIGAIPLAPTWPLVLMGGLVAGLGMGLFDGPLNALIVDHAPDGAARWLNFLHLFFGVGALVAPVLAGFALAGDVDWRLIHGTLAVAALTTPVPFIFMRISKPAAGRPHSLTAIKDGVLQPFILLMMTVLALYVGVEVALSGWLPSFLELEHGFSRGLAGVSVSTLWGGIIVGRILTGFLLRWISPLPILALSMAVACPLALIASLIDNPAASLTGFGLVGVFVAGAFPIALSQGVSTQKSTRGALAGFMVAAAGLGAIAFPPVVGAVAGPFGLRAAMAMTAALCGLAAIAVLWAMVYARRRVDESRHLPGNIHDPVPAAAAAGAHTLERSRE